MAPSVHAAPEEGPEPAAGCGGVNVPLFAGRFGNGLLIGDWTMVDGVAGVA